MEYYVVERKKVLLPFATAWMELESIMLSSSSIHENSMEFPQKTKNGTALWPSNSAAGIIP